MNTKLHEYCVVMRGASAVVMPEYQEILIPEVNTEFGVVDVRYKTRWLKKSDDVIQPGHLWVEIRGYGPSLDEVLPPFCNAGLSCLSTLALSANAAISEVEIELAYDCTKGITARDFFQSYIPPEFDQPYTGRIINPTETLNLLNAVNNHADSERLYRAIGQYRLALDSWKYGRATISMAHLWMAIEALTKAKIRQLIKEKNLNNQDELTVELDVEKNKLDSEVRKHYLLNGDSDCYKKAKEASDGFEHGYLGFEKIRNISKEMRIRMAKYVRSSILDISGLNEESKATLCSESFDDPLGHWPIQKYIRGTINSDGDVLANPFNKYPFVQWRQIVQESGIDSEGLLFIKSKDSLTPQLAEGVTMTINTHETWLPS